MAQFVAVEFSPIDSDRFSVRVARARHVTTANFEEILDFCISTKIDLLIARSKTENVEAAQRMEEQGFFLTDTLVYYAFDLAKRAIPDGPVREIRTYRLEDKVRIKEIAAAAFTGYRGHYHADPNLNNEDCDAGYVSWAERSCTTKSASTEVLVTEHDNKPAGFATMRLNSAQEAEGVLFAVAPESQKLGFFRSLLTGAIGWSKEKAVEQMIYSTQLTNISAQKVLCRVGFEPIRSHYTFHKWFTRVGR